jgi:hypothetical protein
MLGSADVERSSEVLAPHLERAGTPAVSRRVLIVTDLAVACLLVAVGVGNLVIGGPVGIVAGISALALGATGVVVGCLFVAVGGWSRDQAPVPDSGRPVRVSNGRSTRGRR